jgi:3-hydroxyisobutyryl-CoA hydrolase
VGANFFLSRLDGQLGTYLGLTGTQLRGYDVFRAGIATHFVPSDRLEALEERLSALDFAPEAPSTSQAGMQLINTCIEEFVADSETVQSSSSTYTGAIRAAIDTCFNKARVSMIVSSLEQVKEDVPELSEWAAKTIHKLQFVSPTSLAVALEVIRAGSKLDINQAFEQDFQLACVFAVGTSTQSLPVGGL